MAVLEITVRRRLASSKSTLSVYALLTRIAQCVTLTKMMNHATPVIVPIMHWCIIRERQHTVLYMLFESQPWPQRTYRTLTFALSVLHGM